MSKSKNVKSSKNNRKQLSKAARKEKNEVERLRRFLEKNLTIAKKNGWELRSGMWFEKNSACLFGLALAVQSGGLHSAKVNHVNQEEKAAADCAGVSIDVVCDVIGGFDEYAPFHYDEYEFCRTLKEAKAAYNEDLKNQTAFYRLGWRLAKKHLYSKNVKST